MKKIVLILIALCVAVFGSHFDSWEAVLEYAKNARQESLKECMGGDVESCEKAIGEAKVFFDLTDTYKSTNGDVSKVIGIGGPSYDSGRLNCKDYMKVIKKGCALGSGLCCAKLGDEYHPISSYNSYWNKWETKYGRDCSLRNESEAYKYYKKSCNLGESTGCQRYTELQNFIDEIDTRERDKTQKSDITIRRK